MANEKNVLGGPLQLCCGNGGFTREGFCYVPPSDAGNHSVCAIVSEDFLSYSKQMGNDLSTPRPEFHFQGLRPGDKWCLCAARWEQARLVGKERWETTPNLHIKQKADHTGLIGRVAWFPFGEDVLRYFAWKFFHSRAVLSELQGRAPFKPIFNWYISSFRSNLH